MHFENIIFWIQMSTPKGRLSVYNLEEETTKAERKEVIVKTVLFKPWPSKSFYRGRTTGPTYLFKKLSRKGSPFQRKSLSFFSPYNTCTSFMHNVHNNTPHMCVWEEGGTDRMGKRIPLNCVFSFSIHMHISHTSHCYCAPLSFCLVPFGMMTLPCQRCY